MSTCDLQHFQRLSSKSKLFHLNAVFTFFFVVFPNYLNIPKIVYCITEFQCLRLELSPTSVESFVLTTIKVCSLHCIPPTSSPVRIEKEAEQVSKCRAATDLLEFKSATATVVFATSCNLLVSRFFAISTDNQPKGLTHKQNQRHTNTEMK